MQTKTRVRRKYEDGLSATPKFKSGGVKKVMVLGVFPEAKEEPTLLEKFLQEINLPPGSFQFCADLKLINLALGLMSHSSKFPCPFCRWPRNTLAVGEFRTFEGIRSHFLAWEKAGGNPDKAKDFFNCVRKPLSVFPLEGLVLHFVPPPQLHIKMGVTNKLFTHLEGVFPQANEWALLTHVVKEDYHKQFEGISHTFVVWCGDLWVEKVACTNPFVPSFLKQRFVFRISHFRSNPRRSLSC